MLIEDSLNGTTFLQTSPQTHFFSARHFLARATLSGGPPSSQPDCTNFALVSRGRR
jgi:hypothetical protein